MFNQIGKTIIVEDSWPVCVHIACLLALEEYGRSFKLVYSSKLKASGLKKKIWSQIGPEKSLSFEKFILSSSQRTRIEQLSIPPLSLEIK